MSNQPTTSYRETQPVLFDSDEDQQVGNPQHEAESPLPQSTLLSAVANFQTTTKIKHTTFQAHQHSSTFSLSQRTIIPSFSIPNLNQQLPYPNSNYTLSQNPLQFKYFDLSPQHRILYFHHNLHNPPIAQWLIHIKSKLMPFQSKAKGMPLGP